MKKILILSALVTALTSGGAMAVDANLNFAGTVSANTCTLSASDASQVLTIPNVTVGDLYAATTSLSGYGQTYSTGGSFKFSGCPAGLTKITTTYTYQGTVDSTNKNSAIATGTANNVQLIIWQGALGSNPVNVDGTTTTNNDAVITAGAATIPFWVGALSAQNGGLPVSATVGNYSGVYTVAFTYS